MSQFGVEGVTGVAGVGAGAGVNAATDAWMRNLTGEVSAAATVTPLDSFAGSLGNAIGGVQALQAKSDALAVQAATGTLENVHEYTIAATEAKLATQLTVTIRNKAVEAFTEIMRMQA